MQLTDIKSSRGNGPLTKYFFAGTHRAADPSRLLEHLSADLSSFGISRVARLTGLDRLGVEVFAAARPNSRGLSLSQGKGSSKEAAKLSAIMEAIELFHAERFIGNVFRAEYPDVRSRFPKNHVSRPNEDKDLHREIDWTFAVDVRTSQKTVVPYDYVHSNFLMHGRLNRLSKDVSTDGLASGGNLFEAINHGLLELIERIDTECFANSFTTSGALNLKESQWPEICALVQRANKVGLVFSVWNTTGPTEIPSFVACIADHKDRSTPPGYGAGCHLSPRVAIIRAIHEAVQSRLTRISGVRDDLCDELYAASERLRARHYLEWFRKGAALNRQTQRKGARWRTCPSLGGRLAAFDYPSVGGLIIWRRSRMAP